MNQFPTPWDEVGTNLPEGASVDQTLELAGLNWTVSKIPVWADFSKTIMFGDRPIDVTEPVQVKDSFTLFRDTDGAQLTPFVGPRYKVIQPAEAFDIFHEFVRVGEMTMETAGSLSDGAHIWGLARTGHRFTLCDGETIDAYFLLVQSYKYGHSLSARWTAVRYPSMTTFLRTFNVGKTQRGVYTMPHSREFSEARKTEIKNLLGISESLMKDYQKKAKKLAETKMTEQDKVNFLIGLFDPGMEERFKEQEIAVPDTLDGLVAEKKVNRALRKVIERSSDYPGFDLETCKDTAWGLVNQVNHAVDHHLGGGVNTRLESAWFGQRAKLKTKALNMAMVLNK